MAYSNNLRIELITTGDQAGQWGNTTNTNLGTIIEDSIAGYVTVTVASAAQAFTALDGAADEARNAIIRLAASYAGNFSVFAPPVSKLYTIFNDTAYTATIYNSTVTGNTTAAGTGIAIAAGQTASVWSNATNFYAQNTQLTGTPTAPTATFGTNTTQVATTAFVQAALQLLYPVGSIYTNAVNGTNPSSLFNFGTWVAFGAGRVAVGFNAANTLFDTAGETGGAYDAIVVSHTHTATTSTDPGHTHTFRLGDNNNDFAAPASASNGNVVGATGVTATAGAHSHTLTTASAGSSGTNANLQPYITVYMWKRTA